MEISHRPFTEKYDIQKNKMKLFFDASPIITGFEGIPIFASKVLYNLAQKPELELHSGLISINMPTHRRYFTELKKLTNNRIKYHRIFLPGRCGGKYPGVSFNSKHYDLMHYSTHMVPAHSMASDFSNVILTVHDMFVWHSEYLLGDTSFTQHLKNQLPVQAEKAKAIFTVSEFSKQEINKYMGIPLDKIHAVPIAAQWSSNAFMPSDILQKNALTGKSYFLAVSTLLPHKNYIALFTAFKKYQQSSNYAGEKLIIVGKRKENFPDICHALDTTPNVIHLQNIPENDLRTLYENSKGFFLVSKLEGFGIPLLEAMSCNVPACYGKGSSMDEIGRDAAYGVNPENIDEIAETFSIFSAGGSDVQKRTAQAYTISNEYSYAKTVEKYIEIYKSLLLK